MSTQNTGSNVSFWIKVGLGAAAAAAIYFVGMSYLKEIISPQEVFDFIEDSGPLAPVVFILAYGLFPLLPASAMTVAGGALFGPFWGTLYSVCGAVIAMAYPYWISRYLGRKPLEKMLSHTGNFEKTFEKFQCKVENQGWKFVAFTRLVPIFSFTLLNYIFGLTRIGFWTYLVTSTIFIIPGTAIFVYAGYAGREATVGVEGLYWKLALAFLLLLLLAAIPRLIKYVRKLRGRPEESDRCGD